MKKNIILLVSLIIISAVFCLSASALEGKSGPYSYEVKKNGDLKITEFDWDAYGDEDVYIPKMIDGYSVTEIGDSAFSSSSVHSVAVIIPDTIISIGEKAFFGTWITSMHIPASVLSIGNGAFAGCEQIRQFSVDSANPRFAQIDGVLYNKIEKSLVAYPLNKDVNINIEDFAIPEGIVSIAPYAFYKARTRVIILPSTLKSIENNAFLSARIGGIGTSSKVITDEQELASMGYVSSDRVEKDWDNYRELRLSTIESIGESAFEDCKNMGLGDGSFCLLDLSNAKMTEIPKNAFKGVMLERGNVGMANGEVLLSENLKSIGEYAFADGHIRKLILPSSVETIGKSAFSETPIGELSFANNSALQSIGDNAFCITNNTSFGTPERIVLPDGLISIGSNAFSGFNISEITIPASVKSIGNNLCNRNKVNIIAEEGTYAYFWAVENGYTLSRSNDTSWLSESGEEEQPDTSWLNN